MPIEFRQVEFPGDGHALAGFLAAHEWPYHGTSRLTLEAAQRIAMPDDTVDVFWMLELDQPIGVVRLLDLEDLEDGSPLFDLRIAADHRGRGVGTQAVRWLTEHLFSRFDVLHRIEATTRLDNAAMRRVFDRCGYRLEGQLRDAWRSADGSRTDTMIYGITRPEWADLHPA